MGEGEEEIDMEHLAVTPGDDRGDAGERQRELLLSCFARSRLWICACCLVLTGLFVSAQEPDEEIPYQLKHYALQPEIVFPHFLPDTRLVIINSESSDTPRAGEYEGAAFDPTPWYEIYDHTGRRRYGGSLFVSGYGVRDRVLVRQRDLRARSFHGTLVIKGYTIGLRTSLVYENLGFKMSARSATLARASRIFVSRNPREKTGLAIYNASPNPATISLVLYLDDGQHPGGVPVEEYEAVVRTLAPREKFVDYLSNLPEFEPYLEARGSFTGHVLVGSTEAFAAIGILQDPVTGAISTVEPDVVRRPLRREVPAWYASKSTEQYEIAVTVATEPHWITGERWWTKATIGVLRDSEGWKYPYQVEIGLLDSAGKRVTWTYVDTRPSIHDGHPDLQRHGGKFYPLRPFRILQHHVARVQDIRIDKVWRRQGDRWVVIED